MDLEKLNEMIKKKKNCLKQVIKQKITTESFKTFTSIFSLILLDHYLLYFYL